MTEERSTGHIAPVGFSRLSGALSENTSDRARSAEPTAQVRGDTFDKIKSVLHMTADIHIEQAIHVRNSVS